MSSPSNVSFTNTLSLLADASTVSTIEKIDGQPGKFEVTLQNARSEKIIVGSIVASLGWKPYDAKALTHLGYNTYSNVLTNLEFE
ncbi:unnamed protein product, partial [marine sediment metagenome]